MSPSPLSKRCMFQHWLRRVCAIACVAVFTLLIPSQVMATIVHFDTNLGSFDIQLFDAAAPQTVTNFIQYVTSGAYADTMIHRVDTGLGVIQGGGFDSQAAQIPTFASIPLEYAIPNSIGTISMARTSDPNSATSQWFINTKDNSSTLGPSNGGGYAVFGQVLGNGMDVVNAIAAVQTFAYASPFGQVPLINFTQDDYNNGANPLTHLVIVNGVTVVPEPSTIVLSASTLIVGMAGIALRARSRRARI